MMIVPKTIIGLGLLSICRGADLISVREEATPASVSVTVTVDWLYPPGGDYVSSASSTESASWTTESFSSWEGWGPSDSYYPPEDSSSWSSDSTEGGVCPPYTVNSSTTSSEEPEKTTLVTTRTVTITTVTTETYSTADVEEPSSTAADAVYPVPSWTRCPHANDVFSCGDHGEEHGAADAAAVLGMRSEGDDDPEEGESSEDDLDLPEETEVVLSAAGSSHTEAIRSSGWLVALVLIVPVGTAF